MSSRLTKHHTHHQSDGFSVISSDSYEGTTDKVTYASKNQDGRQFEAVTSPNSVHATKLAELAMLVQSNQRPSKSSKAPMGFVGMSVGGPIPQIAPAAYQEPPPRVQEVPYPADSQGFNPNSAQRSGIVGGGPPSLSAQGKHPPQNIYGQQQYQQGQDSSPSGQYALSPRPYISDLRQRPGPDPHYQPPVVHRFATEQQTGYKVQTGSGELKVSAPVGSSEAVAFDGVVQKMSSKVCQ
jgi:hypothetical protein